MRKEWVQCFYNVNYNFKSPHAQSKFAYGFSWFKLLGESDCIKEQIIKLLPHDECDIYNLNLTSLTPFNKDVFESRDES